MGTIKGHTVFQFLKTHYLYLVQRRKVIVHPHFKIREGSKRLTCPTAKGRTAKVSDVQLNSNPGPAASRCGLLPGSREAMLSLVRNSQQPLGNDFFAHLPVQLACGSLRIRPLHSKSWMPSMQPSVGGMNVCFCIDAKYNVLPSAFSSPVYSLFAGVLLCAISRFIMRDSFRSLDGTIFFSFNLSLYRVINYTAQIEVKKKS